jgi:hypothetical protein
VSRLVGGRDHPRFVLRRGQRAGTHVRQQLISSQVLRDRVLSTVSKLPVLACLNIS